MFVKCEREGGEIGSRFSQVLHMAIICSVLVVGGEVVVVVVVVIVVVVVDVMLLCCHDIVVIIVVIFTVTLFRLNSPTRYVGTTADLKRMK